MRSARFVYSPGEAEELLVLIRSEVQRYGQSIVRCDKLLSLVSPTDPIGVQFGHIFGTAVRERWSIEFRNDGMVRFASLDESNGQLDQWLESGTDARRSAEN